MDDWKFGVGARPPALAFANAGAAANGKRSLPLGRDCQQETVETGQGLHRVTDLGCQLTTNRPVTILRAVKWLRAKHPNKDVEGAGSGMPEACGWRIEVARQPRSEGRMYCPYKRSASVAAESVCITSIWSTPKNAGNHARQYEAGCRQLREPQAGRRRLQKVRAVRSERWNMTLSLKFKLAEGSADANDLVERLGEAGCDDAVWVSVSRVALRSDFTREADLCASGNHQRS